MTRAPSLELSRLRLGTLSHQSCHQSWPQTLSRGQVNRYARLIDTEYIRIIGDGDYAGCIYNRLVAH